MTLQGARSGLGLHVTELTHERNAYLLRLNIAGNILFDLSITFSKLSAFVFYGKVFRVRYHSSKAWKWAYWIVLALAAAWPIAFIIFNILQCEPIANSWPGNPHTVCFPDASNFISSVVSSVVIDFAILVIPIPPIWQLKLKARRKLAVTAVFVLGYS